MRLKWIVVDKLPKSCRLCLFSSYHTDGRGIYCFCIPQGEMVGTTKKDGKLPKHCPLVAEKEIEKWKTKKIV